jgi:hypothetical protein
MIGVKRDIGDMDFSMRFLECHNLGGFFQCSHSSPSGGLPLVTSAGAGLTQTAKSGQSASCDRLKNEGS